MAAHIYTRVSTGEQAQSGLGLAAQEQACRAWCAHGAPEAEIVVHAENGTSGTLDPNKRPVLGALLDQLDDDGGTLVVAKLDRASRSVVDLLGLVARSERAGWHLVALDLGIDSSTAAGRLVTTILAAVGEWEARVIGERTTAGLAVKNAQGHRLGRPASEATRTAGAIAQGMRDAGMTWQAIAGQLNADGMATRTGNPWSASTIRRAANTVAIDDRQAARRAEHDRQP